LPHFWGLNNSQSPGEFGVVLHRENSGSVRDFKARYIRTSGGSRGGQFGATVPANVCGAPLKRRPYETNVPFWCLSK